jgi:hypothetical protein
MHRASRYYSPRSHDSSVVQSVERRTVNPYVTGSSPVRGAKFRKARTRKLARAFCFLGIIESLADLDFIHNDVVLRVLTV